MGKILTLTSGLYNQFHRRSRLAHDSNHNNLPAVVEGRARIRTPAFLRNSKRTTHAARCARLDSFPTHFRSTARDGG